MALKHWALILASLFIASCSDNNKSTNRFKHIPTENAANVVNSPGADEKSWYVANSDFTECYESDGPAAKLDEFIGFTDRPRTKDYRSNGALYKVEVINPGNNGYETVWTYYKSKTRCESEEINATKDLANKYR